MPGPKKPSYRPITPALPAASMRRGDRRNADGARGRGRLCSSVYSSTTVSSSGHQRAKSRRRQHRRDPGADERRDERAGGRRAAPASSRAARAGGSGRSSCVVPANPASLPVPSSVVCGAVGNAANNAGSWIRPPPPAIASTNPAPNAATSTKTISSVTQRDRIVASRSARRQRRLEPQSRTPGVSRSGTLRAGVVPVFDQAVRHGLRRRQAGQAGGDVGTAEPAHVLEFFVRARHLRRCRLAPRNRSSARREMATAATSDSPPRARARLFPRAPRARPRPRGFRRARRNPAMVE